LRVLKSSVTLRALNDKTPVNTVTVSNSLYGAIYEFSLPADYLHLLNCVCNFKVNKPFKCYNAGTFVQFPATRLTADMWSQIINNFYMRPMYKRPYYYIHNVNSAITPEGLVKSNNQPSDKWNIGDKAEFNGGFGREPSSEIMIPTDGGGTDIQHLKPLDIKSRYDTVYIDDNNHYDSVERKYGLPRFIKFSNAEASEATNSGTWVRTGKAEIWTTTEYQPVGLSKQKLKLGTFTFDVEYNADTG
jgi:hypothetical protein